MGTLCSLVRDSRREAMFTVLPITVGEVPDIHKKDRHVAQDGVAQIYVGDVFLAQGVDELVG